MPELADKDGGKANVTNEEEAGYKICLYRLNEFLIEANCQRVILQSVRQQLPTFLSCLLP